MIFRLVPTSTENWVRRRPGERGLGRGFEGGHLEYDSIHVHLFKLSSSTMLRLTTALS